jgi:hypothetical protein
MTCRFKLVGWALVMVVLAMPLSALGSCWLQAAAGHCTSHCPMMGGHAPSFSMQKAPAKAEPPDPLARASRPSLQSVFCTFLI